MTHDDDDRDVLARGTRVSEFRVERLLGRGGFGATYLAWDESLEAWRAVKEYLPVGWRGAWGRRLRDGKVGPARGHEADYRWGLERFVREARVLSDRRLKHPNIVGVYRCFPARGTAYLVMELVEGRSLAQALSEEGVWPEARVRPLLSGLADGLSAVHAAGLLHRDVSAANVMLRAEDDSPVLIDFGTARKPEDQGLSIPLVKAGYAAFEQYKGEWEAYKGSAAYRGTRTDGDKADQGPWTDVYGLGAVAYVALSGAVPPAATERFVHDGLRPVAEASVGPVSGALASAVDAALSVVPSQRPQRMGEWLSLWRDEPSVPLPLPPLKKPKEKTEERGRRWWLYGAAAVVVVAAIALASLFVPPRGDGGSAGTVEPGAGNVGTDRTSGRTGSSGTGDGGGAGPGDGDGLGPGEGVGVGGGVYRPGTTGLTLPRLLREVPPQYTAEAMRARIQGTVWLDVIVLPSGEVGEVKVSKSLDQMFGLDEQAIAAARQWLFAPGMRFGEPVSVLVSLELFFNLR